MKHGTPRSGTNERSRTRSDFGRISAIYSSAYFMSKNATKLCKKIRTNSTQAGSVLRMKRKYNQFVLLDIHITADLVVVVVFAVVVVVVRSGGGGGVLFTVAVIVF
ncbi:Hypothetical predicted protein [Octopus vulgaris]|uniref:Transmembrane protein n=1 Tax=Octopus vulgaris TaxID=6645 RepID=A0AA36BXU4_OCTVU|nr:Hypothetical predicted protein [Octopus vulgaris]